MLPEYKIEIIPLSKEAKSLMGFEWAEESIGKRSKIGGRPDLANGPIEVICDECSKPMDFLSQIDSIGDDFVFADVGMVYTYICLNCFNVHSFVDSS